MHGYVFIDENNDKQFSFAEGNTDQTGTEVKSFSFYSGDFNNDASGYNSAGSYLTGNSRNTMACPSFPAPAESGTYRIRFKVDWNSVDAGGQLAADGTPTGSNGILANRGTIIDATLKVEGEETGIGEVKTENGKRSFVSMSSERQTKYGRSSYRLVREQRMLAKFKG